MTLGIDAISLKLPAVLDLSAAAELSDQLKQSLGNGSLLTIDASAVEVLTLPCIQVLLAAANEGNIRIIAPSEEFVGALRDLSLHEQLVAEPTDVPLAPEMSVDPAAIEPAAPQVANPPVRVLTIDDSKTMRDMLKLTLAGAGYHVIQGVDGQDGLDALGDAMVDVIITDINMPRMDGYQVIRELRKKPHLDRVPILVLTTESEKDKRAIAREAGATGWMVKPFDPERLLATVAKVLAPKSDAIAEPVK